MTTETTPERIDLSGFHGSETIYEWSVLFRTCRMTEGVLYLCRNAECFWFADLIGSHQSSIRKNHGLQEHQSWTIEKTAGSGCLVTCTDGNGKKLARQRIGYTDFPFDRLGGDTFTLWACGDWASLLVLLLPSEY
jgi:hypothetical protein